MADWTFYFVQSVETLEQIEQRIREESQSIGDEHAFDCAVREIEGAQKEIMSLQAEIERLRSEKDALRKVIIGMFPMWINAMSYCEHGNRKQLDALYSYYRGSENPMTNEDLKLMFSLIPENAKGGEG